MDVLRRYEAAVEADDDEAVLKLTGEMDEKQLKTAAGNLCFTDANQYGNGRDIAK